MEQRIDMYDTVTNVLIDIGRIITETKRESVTITIKNVDLIQKFKDRIEEILKYMHNVYFEYSQTRNDKMLQYRLYELYRTIDSEYNYKENTLPYKTMNSIKDVLNEYLEIIDNAT